MPLAVCLDIYGSGNATLLIARRLLTIPLLLLLTLVATGLAPLLLMIALLLSLLPPTRGAIPTFGFLLGYLWCETIGVMACFYVWLRHRDHDAFLDANYRVQAWWTLALKSLAERLFRLEFNIQGHEALSGPAAIVIPRHASVADTIIPMSCYAIPREFRMRYVLKNELLFDPCLDIVGNRLPNLFIERHGANTEQARSEVAALMEDISDNEGVLIFPEGTRFSRRKHQHLREKFARDPDMLRQLERWSDLLPPRLGGTLAMLAANPGKDVLFCAHTGFEGSSHFSSLINGSWISATIRVYFWRIAYADIPTDPAGLQDWLFSQWDNMQAWVSANRRPHAHIRQSAG
jgi:1-acyl-sn-glycerol-3-phosphate acyltransferase